MLKILSKREETILYLTLILVTFSAAVNFLLAPVAKKNAVLDKKISVAEEKLKKYSQLLQQKEQIENEYGKFFSPGNHLKNKNPDATVTALYTLENLAKEARIRIIDIRPANETEGALSDKKVLIHLRAEGNIEQHMRFLYNIENPLSLLKIINFQLNSKTGSGALESFFSISPVVHLD